MEQELHLETLLSCRAPSAGEAQTGRNPRAGECALGQQLEVVSSQECLSLEIQLAPLHLLLCPQTALSQAHLQKTLHLPLLCSLFVENKMKHTQAGVTHFFAILSV